MSNSHEIAEKLSEKMHHSGWRVDSPFGTFDWVTFEEFVQKVLAYELSEVPDDFEAVPELQFP